MKEQKRKEKRNSRLILNIALFLVIILSLLGVGLALTFNHYGSDLVSGTFNDTLYNSTGEYVYLNWTDDTNTTYVQNGTYISSVIDFVQTTEFRQLSWEGKPGNCSENMSYIDRLGGYCIDQYEASRPDATTSSMGSDTSKATSKPGVIPWVSLTQPTARTACENAGKQLCTSKEWLGAANIKGQLYNLPTGAGSSTRIPSDSTDDTACVTYATASCVDHSYSAGDACDTGSHSDCVSSESVYDMVGNVWEWTNETVNTEKPCNAASSGYCYPSDSGFQTSANAKYGNDGVYFLAGTQTDRAVSRGGAWNSGASAGPFSAYLNYVASGSDSGIGFRCCSAPN